MPKRNFILVILLIILANIVVLAIAIRNPSDLTKDDQFINLSNRDVFHVSETLNPTHTLVPLGEFKGINDIDEYTYEYKVSLNKLGLLRVSVDQNSIKIGDGNHNFNYLVVVQIYYVRNDFDLNRNLALTIPFATWDEEIKAYVLDVRVRVFISAPQNEQEHDSAYDIVAGNSIAFSILFEKLELNE